MMDRRLSQAGGGGGRRSGAGALRSRLNVLIQASEGQRAQELQDELAELAARSGA